MDQWAERLVRSLAITGVELEMISKYVDDVNAALLAIQKGYEWREDQQGTKTLVWSNEREAVDMERANEGETDASRTM